MKTIKLCDLVIPKETGAKHGQVTQSFIKVSLTQMTMKRLLRRFVHSFENRLAFLKDRKIISGGPIAKLFRRNCTKISGYDSDYKL